MRLLYIVLFLVFSVGITHANPQSAVDSILQVLDAVINQKDEYLKIKYEAIEELKISLASTPTNDLDALFALNLALFDEYGSFIYDSAFHYTYNLQKLAFEIDDANKIIYARLKMSFVLLSSGMFSEALDTLQTIDPNTLSMEQKVEYYDLLGRTYYDMSEYASDPYFAPLYNQKANEYTRMAIKYAKPDNYQKWASMAQLNLRSNHIDSAFYYYKKVLSDFDVSLHQKAMTYASMADCRLQAGDTLDAIRFLSNSAKYDIQSVVTETIALRNLANLLFQLGYIKVAYNYIILANEDAQFYGARQRSFQISSVLPLIEAEKFGLIEKQKKQLELYIIILAVLIALIILFLVIIFKQLTKLKGARKTILVTNNNLQSLNETLKEANKIKEEYIAYYFNISTNYVDKLEYLKESIARNLENKRYGNIDQSLNKLVIKKEREQLFQNFDKIFLSIFPDFVDGFNALFKDEDRVYLSESGAMNTDLRIFALIRMGIVENEKIAKILNFSINTIYSYKNRIKKRSLIPNNEFDDHVMAIKSI